MVDDLKNFLNNDRQVQQFGNLGGLVTGVLNIVFILSGILMFAWALVGVFQYITAGGNKEGLAKARARITWAIIGFLFVVISFTLSTYIKEVINPLPVEIQNVPNSGRINPVCSPEIIADCESIGERCVDVRGIPECVNRDGTTAVCTREIIADCESIGERCVNNNGQAECQ